MNMQPDYLEDRILSEVHDFEFVDEPMIKSIIKYDGKTNRTDFSQSPNVVGSKTLSGKHKPIIDLDWNHKYVKSTANGHGHLYLNEPISTFRWLLLLIGLRAGKVIEPGFFIWSLRRGRNFARLPGIEKKEHEQGEYSYGWFFKSRPHKSREL